MTNYSRTTLRELKKRYLNILKKCLLANLGLILLSTPSIAEPTTYTAEEIYEKLTNGQGVTVDGQIIDTPIEAGVFTGGLSFLRNADYPSNVTFSDGSIFKVGFHVSDSTTLNLGKSYFDGASLTNWGGKVNFSGDVIFENIKGFAVRNQVDTNGVMTLSFKKAEFYNNTLLNSGSSGVFHVYGVDTLSFDGDVIFGKYILDEKGDFIFDDNGNLIVSSNKTNNVTSSQGGAIRSQANWHMTIDGQGIFIGNEAQAQTAYGGALFNGLVSHITFNNIAKFELNKAISTTGNSYGGAIFNTSVNSLTFNDFVSFGGYLKDKDGNLILDDEGEKISVGNMAIAKETLDAECNVVASGNAYGGAIGAGFDNAGRLNFKEVDFIANKVHSESAEAYGGAISTLIEPKNHTSHSIKISGSSLFQDNIAQGATKAYGGAIYNESRQGGGVILSDVSFLGNKALSSEGESYGGAISNVKYQKEDGTYIHTTTSINGPSLFQDNIAQGATKAYGGAIYNESGTKNNDGTINTAGVTLSDVSFIGNKAESTTTDGEAKGGAIYNQGTMKFNGEALFENNIAQNGGAIYNDIGATLEFNKKAEFVGNEASERGSAIFSNSGNITFNDNAIFNDNKGTGWGTIANHYATINFNSGAEFKNNRLDGDWELGGAIFNLSSNLNFNDPDKTIVFEGNSVETGCGGSLYHQYGTINFKGDVVFKGKEIIDPVTGETELMSQATSGGAISSSYGTILFDKGALFEKNKATSGGAISSSYGTILFDKGALFEKNKAKRGGAISLETGTITFNDVVDFIENSAQATNEISQGGVILNLSGSVEFNGDSTFRENNVASTEKNAYGGVIYNESGTKNSDGTIKTAGISFSDVTFIGNKAEVTSTTGEAKGGAIYNKGTMQFNGNSYFGVQYNDDGSKTISGNQAKNGGAIYNEGTIEFNGKTEFIGNKSSSSGGAIYNGEKITFKDSVKFEGNETEIDGGAIGKGNILFEKDALFINNKSTNQYTGAGGAIWAAKTRFLGHAEFIGNFATWGGAVTSGEFNTARFEDNSANGGGAINSQGITIFNGKAEFINNTASWQGGAIRLEGGTVTFKNGVEFSGNRAPTGNDVYFNGVGTINFGAVPEDLNQLSQTETGAEIVEGGFASKDEKGIVNKYSNSTLTFLDSADNTGFKGTFNQYIGKTIAHSEKFLAGTNNILGGELETRGAKIGYTANIGDETHTASLIHHSTATGNSDPTSLTTALKIGASSTALFDSATNGIQANYELTEDMAGAGTVTFKDAHLTLGQTNYNGAYVMDETVTLDLQDGDIDIEDPVVSFANLTGSANLKIDADIVNGENGLELVTDQIETNQEATLKLNLTDVVLSENALDNGLSDSYTATVMKGGTLTYGSGKGLVATDIYSYEVSGANNQITIDAVKFNEGSDVMKSVAKFDGDAAFNMTIGGDSYKMQSDVVMTKNTKSIIGKGKETSTLTGKKITVNGATLNVENVSVSGENQLIDVASGTLNVTTAKVDNIKNVGEATLDTAEVSELENSGTLTATSSELGTVTNAGTLMLDTAEVSDLENSGTLTANGSEISELLNGNKAEVTGGKVTKVTNKGTLTANGSEIGDLVTGNKAEVTGGKVTKVTNNGTMTANGSEIGELMNEQEATITDGELETVTNKEKGMLSLSAGLRAGTVTNEGELTLDAVTVADLTNSATLKANGSTLTKLVNEQEAELTASTVKDLVNTGTMTAKDLTLKGALKGTGTATLSGKLVADDIFKSENKIISDGMEVSENIQKMELADLEIKEGTTLDIGTREVTAKEVTVGDKATLQVTLNNLDEHGTMKADKIEAGAGAGVHLVLGEKFEGGVFDVFKGTKGAGDLEVKHNNLYNVIEVEEGKYSFMTKDTEALQESLGATKEEVSVADAMTKGTSTNEVFNKMQSEMLIALQSLETETVAKAKKALSAVGAKEQPIEQSVASEHLVALQNVVQAELHGTTVGHSCGEEDPRAKVYIKGLYDRTKSSMGEGFRARSKGAVLGVQSEVTDTLTLGVGYATSQTTAKEDLRRTEVDTNTGFISAHYQPNAWWVSGLATFSRGEYEEEKQVLSSTGKALYNVDSWGAQVMTGYDIKLDNAIITPEVGLRYLSLKQEGYTDTLGTTVSGTRSDYLTALVGVKGTWDMGAIRPTAGVTIGYDIISDDVSALNTLANGASYTVNGEALDRLSTTVTTGIEADLGERTTLKLEYSGTFRKEYVDHSGMLKLEVRF